MTRWYTENWNKDMSQRPTAELLRLIQLSESGAPTAQIADMFGVSVERVRQVRAKHARYVRKASA